MNTIKKVNVGCAESVVVKPFNGLRDVYNALQTTQHNTTEARHMLRDAQREESYARMEMIEHLIKNDMIHCLKIDDAMLRREMR